MSSGKTGSVGFLRDEDTGRSTAYDQDAHDLLYDMLKELRLLNARVEEAFNTKINMKDIEE